MALISSRAGVVEAWPRTEDELAEVQSRLAALTPPLWRPSSDLRVGACFVCFPRGFDGPGVPGDRAWAAAVVTAGRQVVAQAVIEGEAPASYRPGFLALREGPLLERAVLSLPERPDVLLVDATGRDHPRRAGLALHLGARLDLPSVGVTDRTLVAEGTWPADDAGATSPFCVQNEVVGFWVRTGSRARPIAVHAAWRTDPQSAVEVVLRVTAFTRTPEPLRLARQAARNTRARAGPAI